MTNTTATWTPELVDEAVAMYIERIEAYDEDKRPDVTTEVTQAIAEELGFKLNSVRIRLSKAKRPDGSDVYIRKTKARTATASTTTSADGSAKAKRVSKVDAQAELTNAFKTIGSEMTEELIATITKTTGKDAMVLAAAILNSIAE